MASGGKGNSSSESSDESQSMGFAGIGINLGSDGQVNVIHGMPGNRPSPELMGLASMLMPMLANRLNKGKGGKGYDASVPSVSSVPESGSMQSALVHYNLDGNHGNQAASSSAHVEPDVDDDDDDDMKDSNADEEKPKEGKGSKKKFKKGKGKRGGGKQKKH